jgi:hypothetical protein
MIPMAREWLVVKYGVPETWTEPVARMETGIGELGEPGLPEMRTLPVTQ